MATTYDDLAISKLSKVSDFVMLQTLRWDDAFSCSLYPNLYSFSDKNLLQTVPGTSTQSPTPVFIMEEESDCCCRMCCATCQPMTLKLYHADPVVQKGDECCGKVLNMRYSKDPKPENQTPIASFDRPGCGTKCLGSGMPVLCACCQDEVFMFAGNQVGAPGKLSEGGGYIATSVQPCCGGGCTPTLELSEHGVGAPAEAPYAWIEGPTCFGGCKDLFCQTPFMISSQKGKSGDIGSIIKLVPESMLEMCCAMCTDVDGYEISVNPEAKMTDTQKLNFLGSAVQLDYMFFEKDNSFCEVDDQGKTLFITMCHWYMCGLLCPVQICIPLKNGGGE